MKSSRWRESGVVGGQAMPRLQMSPKCIGVVVAWTLAKVAVAGVLVRFSDCDVSRFHAAGLHRSGMDRGRGAALPGEDRLTPTGTACAS